MCSSTRAFERFAEIISKFRSIFHYIYQPFFCLFSLEMLYTGTVFPLTELSISDKIRCKTQTAFVKTSSFGSFRHFFSATVRQKFSFPPSDYLRDLHSASHNPKTLRFAYITKIPLLSTAGFRNLIKPAITGLSIYVHYSMRPRITSAQKSSSPLRHSPSWPASPPDEQKNKTSARFPANFSDNVHLPYRPPYPYK